MLSGMNKNHNRSNVAFVFPGIGVDLSGYESHLYSRHTAVYKPFLDEGSALAGADLTEALESDSITELGQRENQIFIYCFSAATFQVYARHNRHPDFTAGYSFGIYAALYAVKAVSFSDGLAILDKAYSLMEQLELEKPVGIGVVIGLSLPDLEAILGDSALSSLYHINSNNTYCHIFCGYRSEIDKLNTRALQAEAVSAVALNITLPYHHPMLAREVREPFIRFLKKLSWRKPTCPVISSINQNLLTAPDELMVFTAQHLNTPITWHKTVERIYSEKCTNIIECGPGISLTQNARFISGNAEWINCKNSKTRLGI